MSGGASRERLRAGLEALGLSRDAIVLVQGSLRRTRPDAGGAATVAGALLDTIGPRGTLVVPTQTAWNSTTSRVHKNATRGMTAVQAEQYLESLPLFDPLTTPSSGMGALAEYVRTLPGAVRSSHPQTSFAAHGADAAELMARHDLSSHLGPQSPLGALYERDALILLLGVDYQEGCTMFHLAEYLYADLPRRPYRARAVSAPPNAGGWLEFDDIECDDGDFYLIGKDFDAEFKIRVGRVGSAASRLFRAVDAVDFAVDWMRRERR